MSSTVGMNRSFFAAASTSHRSETQVGFGQAGVTANSQAFVASDAFVGANAYHSITEGGCVPPPSCGQQQLDLSFLAQAFSLIGNMLQMFSGLFQGGSDPCQPQLPPHCKPPPSCPPSCPPKASTGKTWDVFFDAKQGTKTQQRSPIILDLNGNGRPDITGSNIKGNGKLEGQTVKGFDLDPTARQWGAKSIMRRPGQGAPALPEGTTMKVFDASGKLVAQHAASEVGALGKKSKDYGLAPGQRAEFRDKDGRLVGELKQDGNKGPLMYFYENKNENEWTKPWDSNGGDGILVWDHDGDGKITGGKELFGEFDVDGQKRFSNGYEKLAHHFDKNKDGRVSGHELQGLKIWEDRNGDGITQDGELVGLASRGVRSLNVSFNPEDMSSTYRKR